MEIEKQTSSFGILKIKKWKTTGKRKKIRTNIRKGKKNNLAFKKNRFYFWKNRARKPKKYFLFLRKQKKEKKEIKMRKSNSY
jgi:hypothetical protein